MNFEVTNLIQTHWRKNELPGIDSLIYGNGVITLLNNYSLAGAGTREYYDLPTRRYNN